MEPSPKKEVKIHLWGVVLIMWARRRWEITSAQGLQAMSLAGFITTGVVVAIFVRGHKVAARSGTVFINAAMGIFANAATKSHTLDLMFDLGALHAAVSGVQIDSEFLGHPPDPVGLGFTPIKSNAKIRATGAATKAGMSNRSLCHRKIILCGHSGSNRNPKMV